MYYQLVYLRDCRPERIRHALSDMPKTLVETHERALLEISAPNWVIAHRLFQCVAVASRPLRVEELAEVLAFDFKAGPIPKFREDWRVEDPLEVLLSIYPTLLTLVDDDDSPVVQFSHSSVREFLMSSRLAEERDILSRFHVSMTPAHNLIAQACLGILLHLDENISRNSLEKYPLAEYAAKYWVEHARLSQNVEGIKHLFEQLFDPKEPHFAIWVWIHEPNWRWRRCQRAKRPLRPRGTPLQYAALCGLHTVVKVLAVEHSQDVRSRGVDDDSTLLYLASQEGHVEVARVLLELGADPGARDQNGRTLLHQVLGHSHFDFARLLLEHGAHINARDENLRTPLHQATEHGHFDSAQLLLDYGAAINVRDENGRTPLHQASGHDHCDFARLLLRYYADVDARDENGRTPLHQATEHGHFDFARLLIQSDANVNVQDKNGRAPLHQASGHGHVDLAQLLIQSGADVDVQDKNGQTPLYQASGYGYFDFAQLLIECGADVNVQDKNGRTPLHQASAHGHVTLARLLVEHGADPTPQDEDEWGPLHQELEHGHVDLARFLVENGADATLQAMPQTKQPTTR